MYKLRELRCGLKYITRIFLILKDEESRNNVTKLEIKN